MCVVSNDVVWRFTEVDGAEVRSVFFFSDFALAGALRELGGVIEGSVYSLVEVEDMPAVFVEGDDEFTFEGLGVAPLPEKIVEAVEFWSGVDRSGVDPLYRLGLFV